MTVETSFAKPPLVRLENSSPTTHGVRRRNIDHYDGVYRQIRGQEIANKLADFRAYLDRVTRSDTSWRGMFWDGFADRLAGKRVFEIGCGDGTNALVMAALGAEVVAHDISDESARILEEAAAALGLRNVTALTGDFEALEIPRESFDIVVGKALLHHLPQAVEARYLDRLAGLLKDGGEARFVEPAVNSPALDRLRWMFPVPGRPSSLQTRAFREWKAKDPHPERDNSSEAFRRSGLRYFESADIVPMGGLERFSRWLAAGSTERAFREWSHRAEGRLPMAVRRRIARSQLIVYRGPRRRVVPLSIVRRSA